ncbi:hypothetical protein FGU71_05240 [Erythrobacter insulae]|uniref:Lipoprotein n=1 Tax=Erythrobacter insulae TaxID=2584124 RepID=A0A547PAY8_9SPHN|nr:hypothetical protein [Erythrobacter insulae]TRD11309.1 hypothetical protein FGU71_05240 [Erythrobacter insulae]
MRKAVLLAMIMLLPACAGGSAATYTSSGSSAGVGSKAAPQSSGFRAPSIQREAGLEGITGVRASALLDRLGEPRIDLTEGDSRKLQFAGETCVLDIYLYPLNAGAEPISTHIEARLREGGGPVNRSQCLAEVAQR